MSAPRQTECWRPGSARSKGESRFVTPMRVSPCRGCLRILSRRPARYWPSEEAGLGTQGQIGCSIVAGASNCFKNWIFLVKGSGFGVCASPLGGWPKRGACSSLNAAKTGCSDSC